MVLMRLSLPGDMMLLRYLVLVRTHLATFYCYSSKRLPIDFPCLLLLLREASYGARLLQAIISAGKSRLRHYVIDGHHILGKHGKESESGHKAPTIISKCISCDPILP